MLKHEPRPLLKKKNIFEMRDRITPERLAELYSEQERVKAEKAIKAKAINDRHDKYRSEYYKKNK